MTSGAEKAAWAKSPSYDQSVHGSRFTVRNSSVSNEICQIENTAEREICQCRKKWIEVRKRFQVSGFKFKVQVSGFKFKVQVSGFRFKVSEIVHSPQSTVHSKIGIFTAAGAVESWLSFA